MNHSENLNELATALAKAQGMITGAEKTSVNPFFKSKYADLASVMDACKVPLSTNGLAVVQAARSAPGGIEVETLLLHSSGQWVKESLHLPVVKPDAQGIGSAITYARRYGLAAMVGICPEDDDGNGAVDRGHDNDHKPRDKPPMKPAEPQSLPDIDAIMKQAGIVLDPLTVNATILNNDIVPKYIAIPAVPGKTDVWKKIIAFATGFGATYRDKKFFDPA